MFGYIVLSENSQQIAIPTPFNVVTVFTQARQYLLFAVVVAVWMLSLTVEREFAVDFVPLHYAAQLVASGISPYGAEATAQLAEVWPAPFARAGIAYPLPLFTLLLPFLVLPFTLVALSWTGIGVVSVLASVLLSSKRRTMFILPFLFLPFYRAVVLGQPTLLWCGMAVLLVLGIQTRRAWVVGVCIALLPLKPQSGLIFALAGIWWAWKTDRSALLWAGCIVAILSIISFTLQPGWLGVWQEQVTVYHGIVDPPSALPWGAVLLLGCWRLKWWARIAALQFVLFPLSDLYSALPLLLIWCAIGGPLALVAAPLSWLWVFLHLPNSIAVLWAVIIGPLIVAATWRSWGEGVIMPQLVEKVLRPLISPHFTSVGRGF